MHKNAFQHLIWEVMPMCKIAKLKRSMDNKSYYLSQGILLGRYTGGGWHNTKNLCPFHHDKNAGTFNVNLQTGQYKCFSCGATGDVIDFHTHKHGFSLKDALKNLGGLAHV